MGASGAASTIETERLLLRPWRATDREPFAALNADPAVMEFFPSTLTRTESDALADRAAATLQDRGWGLWAVEVGWRLAASEWGRGYAPEAARAAVRHGFDTVGLDEIVSFTSVANHRSRRVMEKIGMTEAAEFDHPAIPHHPLTRHVLYRISSSSLRQ